MLHLADHIRPLLRDHDCVIIPDFGGLVADVSPARTQPGRQGLSPPTKLVAFNQALTRNDGLLVDALSQHLGIPIAQAREAVRTAVAGLQRELDETNRTELLGIGIFRRAVGRGLAFEYTGTDNLLASAFGLPELAARPVRANDARLKHPRPVLRGAVTRRSRWARLLPGGIIAVAASLLLLVNYHTALNAGYLPSRWQSQLPNWEWDSRSPAPGTPLAGPQQATLGQHDFAGSSSIASDGMTPLEASASGTGVVAGLSSESAAGEAAGAGLQPEVAAVTTSVPATAPTKAAVRAASVPVAAASKLASVSTPVGAKVPAPASPITIKTRTGRYFVIAGAYSSWQRAEQGRKVLARLGRTTHIILPPYGSRYFRLTTADYPDLASARREAQRLRVSTHSDYTTLKF